MQKLRASWRFLILRYNDYTRRYHRWLQDDRRSRMRAERRAALDALLSHQLASLGRSSWAVSFLHFLPHTASTTAAKYFTTSRDNSTQQDPNDLLRSTSPTSELPYRNAGRVTSNNATTQGRSPVARRQQFLRRLDGRSVLHRCCRDLRSVNRICVAIGLCDNQGSSLSSVLRC
jgi:hypothetical protein